MWEAKEQEEEIKAFLLEVLYEDNRKINKQEFAIVTFNFCGIRLPFWKQPGIHLQQSFFDKKVMELEFKLPPFKKRSSIVKKKKRERKWKWTEEKALSNALDESKNPEQEMKM